jgi:hypothetical protein
LLDIRIVLCYIIYMKHNTKVSFYGIFAVLALTMVLGACPVDPGKSPDRSTLKLSGQTYIQNTDPAALLTNSENEKFDGNLKISDGEQGGTGQIKNGLLTYSIGIPRDLSSISEGEGLDYLKGMYSSLKFSTEDVNVAVVTLGITDSEEYSGLLKYFLKTNFNLSKLTIEINIKMVNYVYVDKDLSITADADTFVYPYSGIPITLTTDKINLPLKKGWNSLYSEITAQSSIPPELIGPSDPDSSEPDLSALNPKGNLKMSVGDPSDIYWTLMPSDTSDIIDPQYPEYPEYPEYPDFE